MKKAQIAVLGVAVISGGMAFTLMNSEDMPAPAPPAAPPAPLDQVLVVTRDLSYGAEITDPDLSWIDWPKASVPVGAITKSASPEAVQDLRASYVRIPMSTGEPVRRERLIKGITGGVMSTMLSPGKRAVAIDVSLNSTAGGFILPNDHVDVMRTFRDAEASRTSGREVYGSELLLKNVRVLAIGQTLEKKGAEPVVSGSTATLELEPREAEFITVAQRAGQLTLILRPISDAQRDGSEEEDGDPKDETLTVVKRGAAASFRFK